MEIHAYSSKAGIITDFNDLIRRFVDAASDADMKKKIAVEAAALAKKLGSK